MSERAARFGWTDRRTPSPGAVAGCLVALAYAWVAGGYPSFSWPAALAVLVPGIGVLAYGVVTAARRPQPPVRPLTRRGVVAWSVPVLAFSALEIVNDKLGSTWEHPTLSVLLDPVLADHLGRSLGLLAWLAAGLALARR
ncbi:MAG TPA: hypothetical protein VEL73_07360 [Mycobacteriales bacterium]|nr:hypothetical protein [Mycobacteriales bacterium]